MCEATNVECSTLQGQRFDVGKSSNAAAKHNLLKQTDGGMHFNIYGLSLG